MEKLLDIKEVASIIGCTPRHVREVLVRERGLKAIIIYNKSLRFREADVNDWLLKESRRR